MKIGILTHPLEFNYGGNLQAFAMQKVLNKMGHEAITIDRHNRKQYPSFIIHLFAYIKRLFYHYILRKKKVNTKWNPFLSDDEYQKYSLEIKKFINRNLLLTRRIYTDQLAEIDNEYKFEAYVVGSDQVWLDDYCPDSFLSFIKRNNVKRITYAASSGSKSFFKSKKKIKLFKELSKKFVGISVREQDLVHQCKEKLDLDVELVLDPTMLLNPEEYLAVTDKNGLNENCIFSYILDVDKQKNEIIHLISNYLNLKIVNGNKGNNVKIYPSIDDWINNMSQSKFVITDSFHGTVFAILFNKPFIAIGNMKRGINRFKTLLSIFNLESRLIANENMSNWKSIIKEDINFEKVNNILEIERRKSLAFIQNCLE